MDRFPDKLELFTGRSDIGRLMKQYTGLNWDSSDSSSTMPIKTQTKFYGLGEARNGRITKYWGNFGVLGAQNIGIRMFIDGRNATSDSTSDELATYGETKGITNNIRVASQQTITSRQIPRHANAKCQNFSFMIDENISNRDLELSSFEAEIIIKNQKRSYRVGL